MPRQETRTLYKFDELSESAKERARDWYRQDLPFDPDYTIDDAQRVAEILGIEFATRPVPLMNGTTRQAPKIWYSGFCSQGDGASWEGWYSYAKGSCASIRKYAPKDTELHDIADMLAAAQRRNFYNLTASVTRGHGSNFYSHSGTMSVDVEHADDSWRDVPSDAADDIESALRQFADWIYRQLERDWDWLNSDECVDEIITINEYEFTESGELA